MATVTYTKAGAKATTAAKLDKEVFAVDVKSHDLLKQAYTAYLANGRISLAKTKTRGEVSGGGKKPWKQKGTGRARFGSSRVPIWRGGGITFGPTGEENYTHDLSVKAKRTAIRQALSVSNTSGKLIVVESIDFKGKTAEAAKFFAKINAERKVLLVSEDKTTELLRAVSNLNEVKLVGAKYLNVFDILNADNIVMTTAAVKVVTEWLLAETPRGGDK